MSRSRRARDAVAPSLFPFLAVLLCTMGSLVLILMLIVSGAQASAKKVAIETQQEAEEMEAQIELAQSSYRRRLKEGQLELEQQRLALEHFEEHILELLAELEELKKTSELLEEDAVGSESELAEKEEALNELEKQLAEAAEKLKNKLAEPEGDKPIFAIIPYEGTHGTHRRPIYLECVESGIILQPEGIKIPLADLQPPHGPGNPLDAALRTIRKEISPDDGILTNTAYPLLVVRPSGIRTYALARGAMTGWDDQFGYELVDESLELTFPDSRPGLADKIARTLDLARQRQAALVQAMPRKYREFSTDFRPSNGGGYSGDYGQGGGEYSGGGYRQGSAQENGYRGSSYGSGTGRSSPIQGENALANGGASYQPGGGGILSSGGGGGTLSDNSGGYPQGASASEVASVFDQNAVTGDRPIGQGLASSPLGSGTSAGGALTAGQGAQGGNQFESGDGRSSQAGGKESFFFNQSTQSTTSGLGYGGAGGQAGGQDTSLDGGSAGAPGGLDQHYASNGSHSPEGSSRSASARGSGAGNGGGQGGRGNSQRQSGTGGPGGQQSSSGQSTGAGQSGQSAGFSQPGAPMVSIDNTQQSTESSRPVASRRGRNWAWSRGPQTQTPVVRSIHLHCFTDKWVLLPDDGNPNKAETIAFDQSPEQRAVQLAELIHDRIDGWGMALVGGYWRPVLQVDVAPQASWRFNQLKRLMEGSGIEIRLRNASQPSR